MPGRSRRAAIQDDAVPHQHTYFRKTGRSSREDFAAKTKDAALGANCSNFRTAPRARSCVAATRNTDQYSAPVTRSVAVAVASGQRLRVGLPTITGASSVILIQAFLIKPAFQLLSLRYTYAQVIDYGDRAAFLEKACNTVCNCALSMHSSMTEAHSAGVPRRMHRRAPRRRNPWSLRLASELRWPELHLPTSVFLGNMAGQSPSKIKRSGRSFKSFGWDRSM